MILCGKYIVGNRQGIVVYGKGKCEYVIVWQIDSCMSFPHVTKPVLLFLSSHVTKPVLLFRFHTQFPNDLTSTPAGLYLDSVNWNGKT
jgi:hypothetical protein